MINFRKILCSTDFSEPSYAGLDAACDLVRTYSGQLILVHVVEPIPTAAVPIGDHSGFNIAVHQKVLKDNAEDSMRELVAKRLPLGLPVKTVIAEGDAANQIVRVASAEEADLIVIATHGRTGWRHVVYGSVAERVVRLATSAVLSIRMPKPGTLEAAVLRDHRVSEMDHDYPPHPEALPRGSKSPDWPL
jgi:universal stress protein A